MSLRLVRSVRCALHGLGGILRTEPNARVHALATVLAIGAGLALGITRGEWVAIVLAIVAVWSAEALNTAFEALCDVVHPDLHPAVARAKDTAAAAVLIAAGGAAIIAALVFPPRLLALAS
jgi:diacylglycerol kinase (ATP)